MNRDNRMDELLRQKLGGYQAEPSPGVWEGLANRLPGLRMPAWRVWLSTLVLPVGLLLMTGSLYFMPGNGAGEESWSTVKAEAPGISQPSIMEAERHSAGTPLQADDIAEATAAASPAPPASSEVTVEPSESQAISNQDNQEPAAVVPEPQAIPEVVAADPEPVQSIPAGNNEAQVLETRTPPADITPLTTSATEEEVSPAEPRIQSREETRSVPARSLNKTPGIATLRSSSGFAKPASLSYRLQSSNAWKETLGVDRYKKIIRPVWSLGLYYIPEIYHSEQVHAEKTLYGFDGLIRYTWYNYTLETGLGISRVRNENLYTVDYNAFLGTYQDLDSIAFSVDSSGQNIVPEYFFNEIPVYDSSTSQYYRETVNTYTYLQIPVFLGYRYPMGRVALTLRGGPVFSVLVGSTEPQVYIDDRTNRILRIDDKTPGRLRTNWQFLFNAGLAYQLTSKVSFSLEPGVRFYLNPIYQEMDTKPWSVNLRTGIIYEF